MERQQNILQDFFIPSESTLKNWKKTNANLEAKLTTRANKRMSKQKIIPKEYISNSTSLKLLECLVDYVQEANMHISSALLSLGHNLLSKSNIIQKQHVKQTLSDYSHIPICDKLSSCTLPENEFDILGIFYQMLLSEGEKNILGSYYTPSHISTNMTKDFTFDNNETFLDPCCGSGSFLLTVKCKNPCQLYGFDNDFNAVLIAKINMLLKFLDYEFIPQVFHLNFLEQKSLFADYCFKKYTYIATNPPWGSALAISTESFSDFFIHAFSYLDDTGRIRFLFPESILNVKAHKNIREFIIKKTNLLSITMYPNLFSGVTTKFVDLECTVGKTETKISFFIDQQKIEIDISSIYATKNLVFNLLNKDDLEIIDTYKRLGIFTLKDSIWALGIVTGDNKNKLSSIPQKNMEAIYTGKEITPFLIKSAKNYLYYNRDELQQVAHENIYRASEKLVYKFISNKLTFAYDDKKRLFLNSANILIPKIPNMQIKTVMAFLNSELFQFLYTKLFGEIKILKGNLNEFIFPQISHKDDKHLALLVDSILNGEISEKTKIDEYIFSLYNLSKKQINYIKGSIYGKT